ncbi:NRDE family protein [Pigmentiphaga litoralis]|uniref:Uncharacterized protein with NRDE domain n=1 Tax=Pigmentiphaga litoralis TaxID=516702 RepID=A0A7Y9IVJ0_9BURK|nr:NRDE family protein [Pigmentiphaga litoralis]NYE22530.1 uncharacterized protein with NRDE domain [Pigmentiphaga litoralis]NYE83855.1 uncharacterized protein with NRDE domain [Pigmentiphaga litoralis]
MCLIAFAWDPTGPQRLVVVANRDEFYTRPTAPADWWDDAPDLWAGRDLMAGGTWMGVTRSGRFAALTNYREANTYRANLLSRGHLVADFLTGTASPGAYLDTVARSAGQFNGFNLVTGILNGDHPALWYFGHRPGGYPTVAPVSLEAGVYGLSNAVLDTPWPKVVRTAGHLAMLKATEAKVPAYLALLSDPAEAEDLDLPSTGVPIEWERTLSSAFIVSPTYGTRAQTVIQVRNDQAEVVERSFDNAKQAAAMAPAQVRQATFAMSKTDRK